MNKAAIRRETLARRRSMSAGEVELLSSQITTRLIELIDWHRVRRVHIYQSNSVWNEVATTTLPSTIVTLAPGAVVTVGESSLAAVLPQTSYDLIIVPIVAFDTNRQRIGFGGGWYDRFLAAQPNAYKVGLAFEAQQVPAIAFEPHDIALDAVVTEARIY